MHFIKSLRCFGLSLILFLITNPLFCKTEKIFDPVHTINVKDWGAKGDGIHNDYDALKKITDYVNQQGSGIIFFPKGVYILDIYNTDTADHSFLFANCNGLTIKGSNARISVKGNFMRSADYKRGRYFYSSHNQIIPFYFKKCSNITMEGIAITGNVDKMTRPGNVVEKGQGLVSIFDCNHVRLKNLSLDSSAADGLYIDGFNGPSTDVQAENIQCANNARQGLSICGLRKGTFTNCAFLNTGITGKYGYHLPGAGVDIEPRSYKNILSGNIVFNNCLFENNVGGEFICTAPTVTSNIILENSKLIAQNSTSHYQVILAADSMVVKNCMMDLGKGNLYATWLASPGCRATIQDCTIKSSAQGVLTTSADPRDTVRLVHNALFFTGDTLTAYFPYLQSPNLYFIDNKIFIPSKLINNSKFHSLVQNAIESSGNDFYSDSPTIKPRVAYNKTRLVRDKK